MAVLFDAEDQDAVRGDLATFFGPHADRFLAVYEKMRERHQKKRSYLLSWNWMAFFAPPVWFCYRKQYIAAAVVFLIPIVLSYVVGSAGSSALIIIPIMANFLYVQAGLSRIAKANDQGLEGEARTEYLRQSGGVSKLAGGIVGVPFAILIALAIYGTILNLSAGATG